MTPLKFISVGIGHIICANRVIAVIRHDTACGTRIMEQAKKSKKIINANVGRKIRSLVLIDDGSVIVSCVSLRTMLRRLNSEISSDIDVENDTDEEGEDESA